MLNILSLAPDTIQAWTATWMLPFVRITAVVGTAPIFGNRGVPVRVKAALSIALALAIVPSLPSQGDIDPASVGGLLGIGREVVIGVTIGFAMRLVFAVMELVGLYIANLMGLGFASLIDPQSGASVPVLGQFHIIVLTLVFLGMDGHLLVVSKLAESFRALPVGAGAFEPAAMGEFARGAAWIFGAALQLALPAILALLVVNLAFGVISRAAPQLHVVVIGFPLMLMFGFVMLWLGYGTVVGAMHGTVLHAAAGVDTVLDGLAGRP